MCGRKEVTSNPQDRIGPVDPERFHLALSIYQAALAADRARAKSSPVPVATGAPAIGIQLANAASKRAIFAVQKEFPEADEFQDLSIRLRSFFDILGDRKLIKWGMIRHNENGVELHDAVINALATAPFRKSGVLDKAAFHALVKAEYTRLEAGEKT
jgi:hypothetical protein